MAKKRRVSQSPNDRAAAKKARRTSASPSNDSQRSSTARKSSRAKSVFRGSNDPYFPREKTNTSLPTSDDWTFRIQVVSESTDIQTEMFKKAVQGLVRICFPQNVLDELGVDVVQQHMREQNAPKQNMDKMSEIFRSEMVHRLVWMLAEYLEDTSKVEAVVKSITAASASLHGEKIGTDVLGNVIASLQQLRERIPEISTNLLANDTMLTESTSEDPDEENSVATSVEIPKDTEEITDIPAQPARQGKEIKVSTSWRWDVVRKDVTVENIQNHFHRTVDLFAYHTLSIAKQHVGHDAKRKEIRLQIESLWTSLADEEYGKWVESFQKLQDGDLDMLKRVESAFVSTREGIVSATPAPISAHKGRMPGVSDNSSSGSRRAKNLNAMNHDKNTVKQEEITDSAVPEQALFQELRKQENAIAASKDATVTQGIASSSRQTITQNVGYLKDGVVPSRTPIIDLLWDKASFNLGTRESLVQVIMEAIDQRIPAKNIKKTLFCGTTRVESKLELKTNLLGRVSSSSSKRNSSKVRDGMERRLIPWVVANIQAFPELRTEAFVFVNTMPFFNPVLDIMIDPHLPLYKENLSEAREKLLGVLRSRGFPSTTRSGPEDEPLDQQSTRILAGGEKGEKHPSFLKRGFIEKVLRYLAFANREVWPELKSSLLVRTWKRETGQQW